MRTSLVKRQRQVSNSHEPPSERKNGVKLLVRLQHFLDMLPCKATCLAVDCTHPSRALSCLLPSGLRLRRLEAPPDGFRQQAVKMMNSHDSTYHKLAQLDAETKMTLFMSYICFLASFLAHVLVYFGCACAFYQACGQEQ